MSYAELERKLRERGWPGPKPSQPKQLPEMDILVGVRTQLGLIIERLEGQAGVEIDRALGHINAAIDEHLAAGVVATGDNHE